MIASEETKRLRSLVPTEDGVFFEMSTEATRIKNIEFPILQPIWRNGELYSLESWESSPAALIVEVRFSDLLNVLPGSDYLLGEVKILFSEIVKNGKIEGWYDVTIAGGAPPTIPLPSAFLPHLDNECDVSTSVEGKAQLYIKASWDPPKSTDRLALETMREASHAIQEEMLRTAILTEQQVEKLSILSNSMVAINSVRGISANLQMVQNTLGSVLDICESCLHAFDFTVFCVHSVFCLSLYLNTSAHHTSFFSGSSQVNDCSWTCFHFVDSVVDPFNSLHCPYRWAGEFFI